MDFFGILFDIKNGSKMPYSKNYFDTLFAAKLEELGVKTITGTLPLNFRTSETALRSWTIYGNNTQHNYSAEGTLPLTFTTHTAGNAVDWSISGNDENGTENLFGGAVESGGWTISIGNPPSKYGNTARLRCNSMFSVPSIDTYTVAVFPSSYKISVTKCDSNGNAILDTGWSTNNYHTLSNLEKCVFVIKNASGTYISPSDIEGVCIVKGSTAPDHYIPYQQGVGELVNDHYEIPLSVNGSTVNIPIGSSPLTAGQSVSKASTGVDIAAIAGSNTITTELYNKPEMSITGVDYVGVGMVSLDKYMISVICSADISPYNPNAPESDTSYVYNDSTHTLDTDSQYKTALISWQDGNGSFTIIKTKGNTFILLPLQFLGNWSGEDHYVGFTPITPTGTSYTGSAEGSHLLITYYDSEVDTLTPQEIRESITVSASVHSTLGLPLLDAPLTEGETLTMESVGHDFTTFAGVENTIEPFNPEVYDYGDFEMTITYKGG